MTQSGEMAVRLYAVCACCKEEDASEGLVWPIKDLRVGTDYPLVCQDCHDGSGEYETAWKDLPQFAVTQAIAAAEAKGRREMGERIVKLLNENSEAVGLKGGARGLIPKDEHDRTNTAFIAAIQSLIDAEKEARK